MPMIKNRTRADLKMTILSMLGHPIVKVNITDDQLDACINTAIKKLWRWHNEFSYESFYEVAISQQHIDQGFIYLPDDIDAVTDILPKRAGANDPLFFESSDYQVVRNTFLNGVALAPMSLVDFFSANMRMQNYRIVLGLDIFPFTFNRLENKLILKFPNTIGDLIVMRVNHIVIPEDIPLATIHGGLMFDNETLQSLSIAYAKQVIGQTLGKYEGMRLPGGQLLQGAALKAEGLEEEKEVMKRMKEESCDNFYLS